MRFSEQKVEINFKNKERRQKQGLSMSSWTKNLFA